jgi:hypothetical protein
LNVDRDRILEDGMIILKFSDVVFNGVRSGMFSATPDNFDPRSRLFRRWCDEVGLSSEKLWLDEWWDVSGFWGRVVKECGYGMACRTSCAVGSGQQGISFAALRIMGCYSEPREIP